MKSPIGDTVQEKVKSSNQLTVVQTIVIQEEPEFSLCHRKRSDGDHLHRALIHN